MAIRLNSAEHLRVEAEYLDRDELICNLVTVEMGRDALREENKKLKEELGEKDAHWNDWLNSSFGDELYPLSPSPEPDEFVEKVNKLGRTLMERDEEIKRLKEDKKRLSIYLAEIGEDCDCRDEGARATEFKYGEWFNKITNNEFL